MKTLITSKPVSDGQKSQFATVVADAVRKRISLLVDQLSTAGVLNSDNFQGVLGKGNKVVLRVQGAVDSLLIELTCGIEGCLKLLSRGHQIFIGPTDGKENIAEGSDVFMHIDSAYNDLGLNRRCNSTKRQNVEVYQLVEDATLMRIFTSLGKNLDSLCLTQSQIKVFCRDHHNELEKGDPRMPNLFLFKSGQEFYVAWIYRSSHNEGGHTARVHRLDDPDVVHGSSNNVLVFLPEL